MNNLMTNSFLNYVELKKQARKDAAEPVSEPAIDIESGSFPFSHAEQRNLSLFFQEVDPIQSEITSVSSLLSDLTRLNMESKSARTRHLLRGLKDQMDSDIAAILRKAHVIKTRLVALDASNAANRAGFGENSPIDRTRTAVTNGLRLKLRELMNGFSALRESISEEHKGRESEESERGEMVGGLRLRPDVEEREKAVSELKRSLGRLHQVFLDMAVMVEVQGDQMNDIEENVVKARDYVSGGTVRLAEAEDMRREERNRWWLGCGGCFLVVVIVILVCLVFKFGD